MYTSSTPYFSVLLTNLIGKKQVKYPISNDSNIISFIIKINSSLADWNRTTGYEL